MCKGVVYILRMENLDINNIRIRLYNFIVFHILYNGPGSYCAREHLHVLDII